MDEFSVPLNPSTTITPMPVFTELDALPDDERRIILAWRQARASSKNGVASLFVVKLFTEVLLFIGANAGKVMLR